MEVLLAALSIIPNIFSAISGAYKIGVSVQTAKYLTAEAQKIMKQFFDAKVDFTNETLKAELAKIDKQQLAALAKLEKEFEFKLKESGVELEMSAINLAKAQIQLLAIEDVKEPSYQTLWRPTMAWMGVCMLAVGGPITLLVGIVAQYVALATPLYNFLISVQYGQWWDMMSMMLGIYIAGRSVEKVAFTVKRKYDDSDLDHNRWDKL